MALTAMGHARLRQAIACLAILLLAACQNAPACDLGSAGGALGGIGGAVGGWLNTPAPPGGSVTATPNPDGSITITGRDSLDRVTSTERRFPSYPGPGVEGGPAAGPADRGYVYGKTHYGPDGGGYTDILDANGKKVGCKFFGGPPVPDVFLAGVPPGGSAGFRNGNVEIRDADGNVLMELPTVEPDTDPADCKDETFIGLPEAGGYVVCFDARGRVVEVRYVPPGHPDDPRSP